MTSRRIRFPAMAKKLLTNRLILRPHANHKTHVCDLDDGLSFLIRLEKVNNKIPGFKGFTGAPVQLTYRVAVTDKTASPKSSKKTPKA
jgi:hypothetical protein